MTPLYRSATVGAILYWNKLTEIRDIKRKKLKKINLQWAEIENDRTSDTKALTQLDAKEELIDRRCED